MDYSISNGALQVVISDDGGELRSVKTQDGTEFIWQGDPTYWKSRAPHCFPVVGRLTDGRCTLLGENCAMNLHGFFRKRRTELVERQNDRLVLRMESDAETLAQYPRSWGVRLTYTLAEDALQIEFAVENKDDRDLYFAYGGHPGFNLPLAPGLAFTDYSLRFAEKCAPVRIGMTDACFVGGGDEPLQLENGDTLPLRHELFDRDAIVLKKMADRVLLYSHKGGHSVELHYPNMRYLGIWHTPKTQAPFLCIEPWAALPARQDVVEELSKLPDFTRLAPGARVSNTWSILFH